MIPTNLFVPRWQHSNFNNGIQIDSRMGCYCHMLTQWKKMFLDSYSSEDVQLQWMDNSPVEMNKDELSLPQFELEDTVPRPCKDTFKTGTT